MRKSSGDDVGDARGYFSPGDGEDCFGGDRRAAAVGDCGGGTESPERW